MAMVSNGIPDWRRRYGCQQERCGRVDRPCNYCPPPDLERSMFDLAFILIGAVFLGACMLYAVACDHL
jgi:hypothetical protein